MPIRRILSVMLRRWYIVFGIFACAAWVTVMLAQDGGIYSTRTVVSFMLPAGTTLSPYNGTNDSSIIAFAATVVQEIYGGSPPEHYSTADAPYYGAGIREGALVVLSNSGNQWVSTINKAEIEIQVVGRTFGWVEAKQRELIDEVLSVAVSRQAAVGILPKNRIAATVAPLTTQIEYVSVSRRSQLTAGAAMFGAAIITGAWASGAVDRLVTRQHSAIEPLRPPVRKLKGSTS